MSKKEEDGDRVDEEVETAGTPLMKWIFIPKQDTVKKQQNDRQRKSGRERERETARERVCGEL